jgi:hypothetical protein
LEAVLALEVPVFFEICDSVHYLKTNDLLQTVIGVRMAVNADTKDFKKYIDRQLSAEPEEEDKNDAGDPDAWAALSKVLNR